MCWHATADGLHRGTPNARWVEYAWHGRCNLTDYYDGIVGRVVGLVEGQRIVTVKLGDFMHPADDGAAIRVVQELRRRHEALAEKVVTTQRSPGSNDLAIAEMKKQKLKLKEEITKLAAG